MVRALVYKDDHYYRVGFYDGSTTYTVYVIINRTATSLHIVCNFLLFSYRCLRHNTSHPNYTYINKFTLAVNNGQEKRRDYWLWSNGLYFSVCVKALSLFPLQWRRHYEKKHRCVEEMDDQQQPAPSRVRSRRNDAKSKKQLFGKKKKKKSPPYTIVYVCAHQAPAADRSARG